jgi:rRNA maturation endonuclease Nob1
MGVVDFLVSIVQGPGRPDRDDDPPYRCIKCGGGHDREFQTCPDCGGSFVVPDTSEDETARESSR